MESHHFRLPIPSRSLWVLCPRRRRRARGAADEDRYLPELNLPVIYVAQPYGGMDPAQMEGLLTNYYEYHFLYIAGIPPR